MKTGDLALGFSHSALRILTSKKNKPQHPNSREAPISKLQNSIAHTSTFGDLCLVLSGGWRFEFEGYRRAARVL